MKIAFVGGRGVPALYGGFETAATEIGIRLVERGHEVTAYCRNGYGSDGSSEYQGIKKIYLPRVALRTVETLSHTFVSMLHLAIRPPDVLIVLNPANGPLCIIPRLRRIPFAVHVDGLDWERGRWPAIGRKYIYFASWFCTKIAPALIADSRGIQDFYKRQWNADAHYASYGTYIEESRYPELLAEEGLTKGEYFLVVARLEPENNTDLIIRAFEKVKTDKKLVIVGGTNYEGPYFHGLKAHARDPRIKFLGGIYEQNRLNEIMCNAYAYAHGHEVGGTNPILLKALGCGNCVLYLDVVFNREVVGEAGCAFPKDVDAAAAVFQDLADHPERVGEYRLRARERIADTYTWEKATDDYEELCLQLHNARGARKAEEPSAV